jgi:hypothetical protein
LYLSVSVFVCGLFLGGCDGDGAGIIEEPFSFLIQQYPESMRADDGADEY